MRGRRRLPLCLAAACALGLSGCTSNNCTDSICGDHIDKSRVGAQDPRPPAAESAAEKIAGLDVGFDVDRFERILGPASRVSTYAGNSSDVGGIYPAEGGKARELTARIYKVGDFYVQAGANRTGTVVVMVIQSCTSGAKLTIPRQGKPVTLNQTRFAEMSPGLPRRASYNVPASNPGEFLEFSSPIEVDDGVGEVWGAGPACNGPWGGPGEEPLINWTGTGAGEAPFVLLQGGLAADPWQELKRFRSGKILNLYGKAAPVHRPEDFPLLPGHGTPEELVSRLEKPSDGPTVTPA